MCCAVMGAVGDGTERMFAAADAFMTQPQTEESMRRLMREMEQARLERAASTAVRSGTSSQAAGQAAAPGLEQQPANARDRQHVDTTSRREKTRRRRMPPRRRQWHSQRF